MPDLSPPLTHVSTAGGGGACSRRIEKACVHISMTAQRCLARRWPGQGLHDSTKWRTSEHNKWQPLSITTTQQQHFQADGAFLPAFPS